MVRFCITETIHHMWESHCRRRRERIYAQFAPSRLYHAGPVADKDESGQTPLPALPKSRPRAITPPISREDVTAIAAEAANASPFFEKLPFELRRRILEEAFGGHVVHMDLFYINPDFPMPPEWLSDGRRIDSYGNQSLTRKVRMAEGRPKRWIWSSSDCHRLPPYDHPDWASGRLHEDYWNAAEDKCRFGCSYDTSKTCAMWCGKDPSKYHIGAMGWLQSCRQAYVEGIDVLYGTNTIHTSSMQMISHIDQLLLPQRLARIRSIEIVWQFYPFPKPCASYYRMPYRTVNSYYYLLNTLPTLFPNARSILLCLQGHMVPYLSETRAYGYWGDVWEDNHPPPPNSMEQVEKRVFRPLDAMVRVLPESVAHFTVAISSGLYSHLRVHAKRRRLKVEMLQEGDQVERYWRPLAEKVGVETRRRGYWVQLGRRDKSWPWQLGSYDCDKEWYPEDDDVFYRRPGRP